LLAILIVGVFTFGGSYIIYKVTSLIIPMRVTPESEKMGLDLSQHDETYLSLETDETEIESYNTNSNGTSHVVQK
jgi:Amt family ammonium transporter